MKMIKISKKYVLLLLITFLLSLSVSCFSIKDLFSVKTVAKESVTLSINQEVLPYVRSENLPTYTIDFNTTLNVTENKLGDFEVIFYNNDDFEVSKIIADLIEKYENKQAVSTKLIDTLSSQETWMNYNDYETKEREQYYIKVKNNTIYNEICYITLENGLQLSIIYARFSDYQNTTYYRWRREENIRIILHYPLMMYYDENEAENRFVVMALPNGVIYHLDVTSRKIDKIINNESYLEESFYTYSYVNSYEEDYQKYVDYYINNLQAEWIDSEDGKLLTYDYLGHTFGNLFTEENFVIKLLK